MTPNDLDRGLAIEVLRSNLHYNLDTGEWIWLISQSNVIQAGSRAGCITDRGYWRVRFKGTGYYSARLAWFYVTGEWPSEQIDHINRDRLDDRWENLREATFSQNKQNTGLPMNNTSGVKGVSWRQQSLKWEARVDNVYLGLFDTIEEAKATRDEFVARWHGEFGVSNSSLKGA